MGDEDGSASGPEAQPKFHSENDLPPPGAWAGWERQRLKPPGATLLRPLAWSAFFLAATPLPLLFPDNTPNDSAFSSALFAVAWSLVLLPLISVGSLSRHPSQSHGYDIFPLDMPTLTIAIALFMAHVVIDPAFGWASYAAFWASWLKLVRSLTDATHLASGRWIKEIDPARFKDIDLADGWAFQESHFKPGVIGVGPSVTASSRLVIEGVRVDGIAHLGVSLLHRSGFRHDPFQRRATMEKMDFILENPPFALEIIDH